MEDILESLGLTELESKIFTFLLREGPNNANTISRKTGIHRRNAYDALERLILKGFLGYITEGSTKMYQAVDPAAIKSRLEKRVTDWNSVMPTLEEQMSLWDEKKSTIFLRGEKGLQEVFFDQIETGKEILIIATHKEVEKVLPHFFKRYELLRSEKGIKTRMIFDTAAKELPVMKDVLALKDCKVKFVTGINSSATSTHVYGNKVAIVLWGVSPFAIKIEENEIAKSYREQFEVFWGK